MRVQSIFLMVVPFLLLSCSSTSSKKKDPSVNVAIVQGRPELFCKDLGHINESMGSRMGDTGDSQMIKAAQKRASQMGGNTLVNLYVSSNYDGMFSNPRIQGSVYDCSDERLQTLVQECERGLASKCDLVGTSAYTSPHATKDSGLLEIALEFWDKGCKKDMRSSCEKLQFHSNVIKCQQGKGELCLKAANSSYLFDDGEPLKFRLLELGCSSGNQSACNSFSVLSNARNQALANEQQQRFNNQLTILNTIKAMNVDQQRDLATTTKNLVNTINPNTEKKQKFSCESRLNRNGYEVETNCEQK